MKNFFIILFGGLACLGVGATLAQLGPRLFSNIKGNIQVKAFHSEVEKNISVFTAEQEEDVIDSAAKSLSLNASSTITSIGATTYIVRDVTNGKTVFEADSLRMVPIASLTKLITAVVARQNIDPDTKITLGPKVMAAYGNTAGFRDGEIYTAGDLIYPLLMVSSNDAAEALARGFDRVKFIKLMNDFTQNIGAYHTYIADPAGLSASNVSSATDMATILAWIMKNDPTILDITKSKSKTIRNHTWLNPTHALSWSYYLGGKNGYIPESNRTTAGLFSFDDSKTIYAVVALGSQSRDRDIISLLEMVKSNDAKAKK